MHGKDRGRILSRWGCPVERNTLAKVESSPFRQGRNLRSTMLRVKIHHTWPWVCCLLCKGLSAPPAPPPPHGIACTGTSAGQRARKHLPGQVSSFLTTIQL